MAKFKVKAFLLMLFIFIIISGTTGCSLAMDVALDILFNDSNSEQSSQLSRDANLRGLELVDEDKYEEALV